MRIIIGLLLSTLVFAQGTRVDYPTQLKRQPNFISDNNGAYTSVGQACADAIAGSAILSVSKHWLAMPTQSINCQFQFAGGSFQAANGAVVTMTAGFIPPVGKVFDVSLGGRFLFAGTVPLPPINTTWFGADPTNTNDSRPAIDGALYSLMNTGGTVCSPPGAYLLNSYHTLPSMDRVNFFTYHNGIHFTQCGGSKAADVVFSQGPGGWGDNTRQVFEFGIFNGQYYDDGAQTGTQWGQNGFQNADQNGGYHGIQGNVALTGASSITAATTGEACATGNFVAIIGSQDQGPITPEELDFVTSSAGGVMQLKRPLVRSYPTYTGGTAGAYFACVTRMVVSNTIVDHVTFRGVTPLLVSNSYNTSIKDNNIQPDYTFTSSTNYVFANANWLYRWADNNFSAYPQAYLRNGANVDLGGNQQIDVFVTGNTGDTGVVIEESPQRMLMKGNNFDGSLDTGGAQNSSVEGNSFTMHDLVSGLFFPVRDGQPAPNEYNYPFGNTSFVNNIIRSFATTAGTSSTLLGMNMPGFNNRIVGNNIMVTQGTAFQSATGAGINGESLSQLLSGNTFSCGTTEGIPCVVIGGSQTDSFAITGNIFIGTNASGTAPLQVGNWGPWAGTGTSSGSTFTISTTVAGLPFDTAWMANGTCVLDFNNDTYNVSAFTSGTTLTTSTPIGTVASPGNASVNCPAFGSLNISGNTYLNFTTHPDPVNTQWHPDAVVDDPYQRYTSVPLVTGQPATFNSGVSMNGSTTGQTRELFIQGSNTFLGGGSRDALVIQSGESNTGIGLINTDGGKTYSLTSDNVGGFNVVDDTDGFIVVNISENGLQITANATNFTTTNPVLSITAATNASPSVITLGSMPFSNLDTVTVVGALGNTAINGTWAACNISGVTMQLCNRTSGIPVNGNGAYAGSGTIQLFGNAQCVEGLQGNYKVVTCVLTNYTNTGAAAVYHFPAGFAFTPQSSALVINPGGTCGTYDPTGLSVSTITLPANAAFTTPENCAFTITGP